MNKTDYLHNDVFDFVYKGTFCFFSELFDILQYSVVAVTIPSIVPMINEFFICLPPDFIVCTYAL